MSQHSKSFLISILGPTACGKTNLAVNLASSLDGEILSADSRQVYRDMDVGTGKDLQEYFINGHKIPHHLIDIKEAGEQYDVFHFQTDCWRAYLEIIERKKQAILCGGTGMYLQAALAQEKMIAVPKDELFWEAARKKDHKDLVDELVRLKPQQHNQTDLVDLDRTIRALEIAKFEKTNPELKSLSPIQNHLVFGIAIERSYLRERIQLRLDERLKNGMIEEVEQLLQRGLSPEQLDYYGLEYRFLSRYLCAELSYDEMYEQLLQAIRRFAKKQQTWFRRMEKQGTKIHWINIELSLSEKLSFIQKQIQAHGF